MNEWTEALQGEKTEAVLRELEPYINDLQAEGIRRFADLTRHGGSVDLVVRKDGREHHFEADWLVWLFRPDAPAVVRARKTWGLDG